MRNLKASVWVSCCIHLVALVALSFLATSFQQRSDEPALPVVELIESPVVTPPKLIEATVEQPAPAAPPQPAPTLKVEPAPQPVLVAVPPPAKPEPSPSPPPQKIKVATTQHVEKAEKPILTEPVAEIVSHAQPNSASLAAEPGPAAIEVSESSGSVMAVGSSPAGSALPRYVYNPAPTYPVAAQRHRQEGTVVLRVAVNSSGRANEIAVKESSGYPSLDEAARTAVHHWRFEPARAEGKPVSCDVEIPVRFQLAK